jgi:hypothetical protein
MAAIGAYNYEKASDEDIERITNALGPETAPLMEQRSQLEEGPMGLKALKQRYDLSKGDLAKNPTPETQENFNRNKEAYEKRKTEAEDLDKKIADAIKLYQDELTETLTEKGYTVIPNGDKIAGVPVPLIKDPEGKQVDLKDIFKIDSLIGTGSKQFLEKLKKMPEEYKVDSEKFTNALKLYEELSGTISETKNKALESVEKYRDIPSQEIEKTEDKLRSMGVIPKAPAVVTPPAKEEVSLVNLPPVRDMEETLSRLLYNNTRVV